MILNYPHKFFELRSVYDFQILSGWFSFRNSVCQLKQWFSQRAPWRRPAQGCGSLRTAAVAWRGYSALRMEASLAEPVFPSPPLCHVSSPCAWGHGQTADARYVLPGFPTGKLGACSLAAAPSFQRAAVWANALPARLSSQKAGSWGSGMALRPCSEMHNWSDFAMQQRLEISLSLFLL